MHFDVANSANQITNYMGTSYILSILIAFLADMFIGRPKSVLISACFEIVVRIFVASSCFGNLYFKKSMIQE